MTARQKKRRQDGMVRRTYYLSPNVDEEIRELRQRAGKSGELVNRSEIVRAGLAALSGANADELRSLLGKIERVPLGRPRGKKG